MKKNRIACFLLALILAASLLPMTPKALAEDSGDYGWPEMQGDIAMRVTQDGTITTRLIIGETYTLQFWLQNICPYAIALPIAWDPEVIEVVDPLTGNPVSSGKKSEGLPTGFYAGSKCYAAGYDYNTYEPLYWNGKPVFTKDTQSETEGYPYLNAEAGHYRFLYYVSSPNAPKQAQMFLELYFRVIGKGDPNFHIATWRDGIDCYDPAEPDGVSVVLRGGTDGARETLYGTAIPSPNLLVFTEEEYLDDANSTVTDIIGEIISEGGRPAGGTTGSSGSAGEEPEVSATMIPAQHLSCFPYTSSVTTKAVCRAINGKVTENSDYILPASLISDLINAGSAAGKRSVTASMPDEIIEKDDYTLYFSVSSMEDLARAGISMLYIETPWAYIGLNAALIAAQARSGATARLTAQHTETGLKLKFALNSKEVKGFSGPALRLIFPYTASSEEGAIPIPVGQDVFRTGSKTTDPISLYKADAESGAIICLASSFCEYRIEQGRETTFDDLEDVAWATEAITGLAQQKIINGVGDGLFDPNSPVTREQFATLMVKALGMYDAGGTNEFQDVAAGSYYERYVATAQGAKLVNGVSEDRYGVGEQISRQDMAVIAYRALNTLAATLPSIRQAQPFTDDAEIAEYAREAVYALYETGIINGVGEGAFAPQGTATRAEAAKMLSGILELAKGVL